MVVGTWVVGDGARERVHEDARDLGVALGVIVALSRKRHEVTRDANVRPPRSVRRQHRRDVRAEHGVGVGDGDDFHPHQLVQLHVDFTHGVHHRPRSDARTEFRQRAGKGVSSARRPDVSRVTM